MEKALPRKRLHQTRNDLSRNDKQLFKLHLKLSYILEWEDWEKIDIITLSRIESTPQTPMTNLKQTVIKLSNRPLTVNETNLLAKEGNFSITLQTTPTEEIIANIEDGIEKLPPDVKEVVCSESARILRKAKPPKSNISRGEKAAIRRMQQSS
ncbi:unnamed protein product [Psylliodes chrysocephalus]|uniref:Uncharacterized protein n=1 Tax=Psylliodes chrysocephalus TaxID=3402493 RepID=A0A9P0CIG2_9CUCU|nr:unnamed protein product [Psylliodes chrysocephala]